MNYLFLDTNILLHFKTFDEIKWTDYVIGEYHLSIAPVVLDELDKHKYHVNAKTARRQDHRRQNIRLSKRGTGNLPDIRRAPAPGKHIITWQKLRC